MSKKIGVLFLISVLWGGSWLALKMALLDGIKPMTLAALRFVIAMPLLAIIGAAQGAKLPRTRREWMWLALAGLISFTINYMLVFWGTQFIPSGLASVLQATIPAFGLLFGALWLNEKPTPALWLSVVLGILGVGIIFGDQLRVSSADAILGTIALALTAITNGLGAVIIKKHVGHLHPTAITLTQQMCGTPVLILVALISEGSPLQFHWTARALISLLYLAIGGSTIAFVLYYWLLRHWQTSRAMLYAFIMPIVSVTLGWLVLGEQFQPQTLIGTGVVLSSVIVALRK